MLGPRSLTNEAERGMILSWGAWATHRAAVSGSCALLWADFRDYPTYSLKDTEFGTIQWPNGCADPHGSAGL